MPLFERWKSYRATNLFRTPDRTAYAYRLRGVQIDADGAPNAYCQNDRGLDALKNAGYPEGHWRNVLVPDPGNPSVPYLQPNGLAAGCYVSQTALRSSGPDTNPATYVDASTVPYIVFPGSFYAMEGTGKLGDFVSVRALDTGATVHGLVADIGPNDADLGEISLRLAEALSGVAVDARTGQGAPPGELVFVVFPYSKKTPAWPLSAMDLTTAAEGLVAGLGGWNAILTDLSGQR